MIVRKAKKEDKAQLMHLMEEFGKDTIDSFIPQEFKEYEEYKNKNHAIENAADDYLSNPKYILFVVEESGKLLGHVCGEVKNNDERKYKLGYVHDWFVLSGRRGKGVGKQLFDIVVEEFKKQDCKFISLDAFVWNEQSLKIYHQMGFYDRLLGMVKKI